MCSFLYYWRCPNLVSGAAMGRGQYENCKTDRADHQQQKIDAALRRGSVWIDFWRHALRVTWAAMRAISVATAGIISRKT